MGCVAGGRTAFFAGEPEGAFESDCVFAVELFEAVGDVEFGSASPPLKLDLMELSHELRLPTRGEVLDAVDMSCSFLSVEVPLVKPGRAGIGFGAETVSGVGPVDTGRGAVESVVGDSDDETVVIFFGRVLSLP